MIEKIFSGLFSAVTKAFFKIAVSVVRARKKRIDELLTVNQYLSDIQEFCGLTRTLTYYDEGKIPAVDRKALDIDYRIIREKVAVVRNAFVENADLDSTINSVEGFVISAYISNWGSTPVRLYSNSLALAPLIGRLREECKLSLDTRSPSVRWKPK